MQRREKRGGTRLKKCAREAETLHVLAYENIRGFVVGSLACFSPLTEKGSCVPVWILPRRTFFIILAANLRSLS